MVVRLLANSDAQAVEAFLQRYAEASMFLRSNIRSAGLDFAGQPYGGRYHGAFAVDGCLAGLVAHSWSGDVLVQAPDDVPELCAAMLADAASRSAAISGVNGPADQARRVLENCGLADWPKSLDADETLFSLRLADLRLPPALAVGAVQARATREGDTPLLAQWRLGYEVETLGATDTLALRAQIREQVERQTPGSQKILEEGTRPVALAGLNARLPDMVQVGGVWTPPEERGRGYARAVTAAVLTEARRDGAEKAVLFTGNPAAAKAYGALGFQEIGTYSLALFAKPYLPPP